MHQKLSALLAALLLAATANAAVEWSPTPVNNNLADAANYWPIPGTLDGEDLVFGNSTLTALRLNGTTLTLSSIKFSEPGTTYGITLSDAVLNITGGSISAPGSTANAAFANRITLEKNSRLNFYDSTPLGANVTFFNLGGEITFGNNSSAGSATLQNAGKGTVIRFNGNSTAGASTILNSAPGTILFTDNASLGTATINNIATGSKLILEGNNSLGAGNFHNGGNGTSIIFNGNTTLAAKGATDVTLIANSRGVGTILLNGNLTTANGTGLVTFNNTAANSRIIIAPGSGNTVAFNNTASSNTATTRFNISNNNTSLLLDGTQGNIDIFTRTRFFLYGNGTNMEVVGNVVMRPTSSSGSLVNNGTLFVMNGTRVNVLIHGNETSHPKLTNVRFRNDYTTGSRALLDSTLTISGHTELTNVNFTYGAHREGDATVLSNNNTINILGNVAATTTFFSLNSSNSTLNIGGNAHLAGSTTFNSTSENNTIDINSHANLDAFAFTVTGNNNTLRIHDNAQVGGTGAVSIQLGNEVTGSSNNNFFHVTGDARMANVTAITVGPGSHMLIDGNAYITGNNKPFNGGIGFRTLNGAHASVTIGGNATIDTFRINLATTSLVTAYIRDYANLKTAYIRLTGNSAHDNILDISMADNKPLEIGSITGTYGRINFSGEGEQALVLGQLQNTSDTGNLISTYLTFTQTDNATGSVTLDLPDAAKFSLNRSNTITGNITLNSGTLILNHANATDNSTLVINNGGTLNYDTAIGTNNLTLGGLGGTGAFDTSRNGTRNYAIGNNSRDTEFSGTLSGSGNITKIGDGTLSFANVNTTAYTGQVAVNQGALQIIAPTSATFNAATSITLAADTRLVIGIKDASTQLSLNTLSLDNNGQLALLLADPASAPDRIDNFLALDTAATIADGGNLHGTTLAALNSARRTFTLTTNTVTGTNFDLTSNAPIPFNSPQFAATSNQKSIAAALDKLPDTAPVIAELDTLSADGITAAFNQINPSALTAISRLAYLQSRNEHTQIANRLAAKGKTLPIRLPGQPEQPTPWSAYFSLQANQGSVDSNANSLGYDTDLYALMVGAERALTGTNEGLFGFALTYTQGKADLDHNTGDIDLRAIRLTAYSGWTSSDNHWFQIQGAFAYNDYETTRATLGATRTKADAEAYQFSLGLELGKYWQITKNWKAGPIARLNLDQLWLQNFDETNSAYALEYPDQNMSSIESQLALRAWREWTNKTGAQLQLNLQLGWTHQYSDDANRLEAAFIGSASSFTVTGPADNKNAVQLTLGFQCQTQKAFRASLNYEGRYNSDQTDHALAISFGKQF